LRQDRGFFSSLLRLCFIIVSLSLALSGLECDDALPCMIDVLL